MIDWEDHKNVKYKVYYDTLEIMYSGKEYLFIDTTINEILNKIGKDKDLNKVYPLHNYQYEYAEAIRVYEIDSRISYSFLEKLKALIKRHPLKKYDRVLSCYFKNSFPDQKLNPIFKYMTVRVLIPIKIACKEEG